jgi:DNA-binding response OmpR family regulator
LVQQDKKRILLVEDEPNMAFSLQFNLQLEGFDVVPAVDGLIAITKFENEGPFDLIILDVMLPEIDGFEVARRIRLKDDQTHILMLTALAKEDNRIKGFEAGIDDYITKPFHLKELVLRVKRMLKRAQYMNSGTEHESTTGEGLLIHGPFQLNYEILLLNTPQGQFSVTPMEADILREFFANPTRVLSRQYLLDKVWGVKSNIETRTVDNFIVRLRKYLEANPAEPTYLISVRGRGYRMIDFPEKPV